MNKPIAVLAGNFEQFKRYQLEHLSDNLVYAASRNSLIGKEFSNLVVCGTFFEREDSIAILELARTRTRNV